MTVLVTRGLTKRYGGVNVVDGLDLAVNRGELYGFLGPNGAGKTTTIRLILGLIFPSRGEVELLGSPMSLRGRDESLRRTGALIEEPAFYRFLSGRRNLEAFARAGRDGEEVQRRLSHIDDVLEQVGLSTVRDRRVKAYSQGMRQRLGIALALLGRPDLLVLDEPTNGLDPAGMREVRLLLRDLADGGTTVFVSSHLLAEVEAMCDRVGVLSRGRLVAEGPPGNLRGGAEHLRIEVGDPERARAILRGLAGVADVGGEGRVLRVHLDGASAAQVNAALVSGGVAVEALVPERDTLEDVFMSLVEGSGVQG